MQRITPSSRGWNKGFSWRANQLFAHRFTDKNNRLFFCRGFGFIVVCSADSQGFCRWAGCQKESQIESFLSGFSRSFSYLDSPVPDIDRHSTILELSIKQPTTHQFKSFHRCPSVFRHHRIYAESIWSHQLLARLGFFYSFSH